MPTLREQLHDARLMISKMQIEINELVAEIAELKVAKPPALTAHARAISELEASGLWYFIGKGRVREGEPLYAVQICEPQVGGGDNEAEENESIIEAVKNVLSRPRSWIRGRPTRRIR
jgi:hypothetical protein